MRDTVTVTDENGNKHEISALADEMLTQMYLRAKKAERGHDEARRQAATLAIRIEDLKDVADEARDRIRELERVSRQQAETYRRLVKKYNLWRERALLARRKYHDEKGHAEAWTPVEEWKPERAEGEGTEDVLAYRATWGDMVTAYRFCGTWYSALDAEEVPGEITHVRPLPAAPGDVRHE